jgi:hypothetical protein
MTCRKIRERLANRMKRYFTQNNLLTFLALIAFVFCVYFGMSKSHQPMWVLFMLCIALLFFANLERIKRLRFDKSGFEAETREVVKEARDTIKELQDLSKIMASTTLGLVKRTGRWGGYSYDEKEKIKNETLDVLERLGISDEDIEIVVAESNWHKFTEVDYVHYILGGSNVPGSLPENKIEEWKQLRRRGLDSLPSPEELTLFLEQCGLLNNEGKDLIEDYEHYIKSRQQRRPTVWSNRGNWSHLEQQNK